MPTHSPDPVGPDANAEAQPDEPQPLHQAELTPAEREQLADAKLQKMYRQEALRQLRRLQCPGCGESELF